MSVIGAAFSQRRKTLRNSLVKSGALQEPSDRIEQALIDAGVDPGSRPQELELEAFAKIAGGLVERGDE